jgi:hypothetical protein
LEINEDNQVIDKMDNPICAEDSAKDDNMEIHAPKTAENSDSDKLGITDDNVVGDVIFAINGLNYTVFVSNADVASYEYTPVNDDMIEVVATFAGNDNYNVKSSDAKEFNVNRNPINIIVSVNSPINVGDSATATINMAPAINATVKLRVGNKIYDVAVVDGVGNYNISGLTYGHHDVNVTFAGDAKYVASGNHTTLNVNKIENYVIDVSVGNIEFGNDETIVVVLPADVDPSRLTVKVDGEIKTITSMVNGVATIVVSALNIGNHEVDVSYAGDEKYDVNDNNSNFAVCSSDASIIFLNVDNHTYGENTTFKIILPNDVTKNVTIIVDRNAYSVKPDDNGIANLTLNNLTGGLHEVTATYPGDGKYLETSKSATFIIPRAQSYIDVEFTTPQSVGSGVLFKVTMGQRVNSTVKLNVGDDSYYFAVVDGVGTYTVSNLASGKYDVKATFAGDDKYLGSVSNNETLVISKIKTQLAADAMTVTYNGNKYLVVTLKDSNGKAVGNAKVTVNLNGAKTLTTDGKGQVKLSTNGLAPNAYTAKITFTGNAVYDKSSKDVKVTVKKATLKIDSKAVSFKAKVKTKKYTITLKDSAGRFIKNAKLTLKVKGKSYSATTDSKGKATFKIKNLGKKGTYKADIVYGGNNLYNKIAKTVNIKCK